MTDILTKLAGNTPAHPATAELREYIRRVISPRTLAEPAARLRHG